MTCVDVRSGSWLSVPLRLCLEGCVVDIAVASCCLSGSRRLLSGCWQYPDPLGLCGNSG